MIQVEKVKTLYADSFNIDAFGRLRTSELTTQFDGKQLHDNLPLFYDTETIGTGGIAHSTANAESTLTTSTGATDVAIMQTKQRFNYMTGKSALGLMTFRNFDNQTNVIKRVGYFNSNTVTPFNSDFDGFYLEVDGTNVNFVISKGGTKNTIAQSSWNGDKLDGTGKSGVNLSLGTETGNLLFWFQFEWLGVGSIEWGFVYNGAFYTCHKEDHILGDGVYMQSPNHSLRYEIRNTGTSAGTFRAICSTFNTEGAINKIGKTFATYSAESLSVNSTTTWESNVGLRLQSTKFDTLSDLLDGSILETATNKTGYWALLLNPTPTVDSTTWSNYTNSSMQHITAGQVNIPVGNEGTILQMGTFADKNTFDAKLDSAVRLGATIGGTADKIYLAFLGITTTATIYSTLNWRELS